MPRWPGRKRETTARVDRVRLDSNAPGRSAVAALKPHALFGALLTVAFLIALEFLFPGAMPRGERELHDGQIASEDIVAPFDFDVLKSEEQLAREREMAESGVVPVFRLNESLQIDQRKRLGDLATRIYRIREGAEPTRQKLDMLGELGVALGDTTRQILLDPARSESVIERAREVLYVLYERGIVGRGGAPELTQDDTVVLLQNGEETIVRLQAFHPQERLGEAVFREASRGLESAELRRAVVEVVTPFLSPNVTYDAGETERRRREARDSVTELTDQDFKEDETIVSRGERITSEHLNIMRSMALRRAELLQLESGPRRYFPTLGRILVAGLLLGALFLYFAARRVTILLDGRCHLLFVVLVAIVMAATAGVARIPEASPYLVPIAILSMLTSMLFSFEIAVVSTFITILLAAFYAGFGLPFVFVSVMGGVVAAHSVRRVRHREDFYWSAIRVVAAYAMAIGVSDIARVDVTLGTLTRMGLGGLNAMVSMGVVMVALPLFERGFRVTTGITLLELADMNKPLLRKMAMSAPGTYHHSIVVGNLAEAAAEAIGANALLARVGSYYHDIGKLTKPGYFVENQQGLDQSDSKHTGLRAKVSSLIIGAHVKDGVELARKEGLPEPVIEIIREHHGTSLMEFFHNRAIEEAENPDEVSASDYRYPGPRPRSKESAIVMLADAIEARVRSIGEPMTQKRIETEIEEIIDRRWQDHQLDAAELTISDLRKIRDAFFRVLVGMYHQRVKYPDQDGSETNEPPSQSREANASPRED